MCTFLLFYSPVYFPNGMCFYLDNQAIVRKIKRILNKLILEKDEIFKDYHTCIPECNLYSFLPSIMLKTIFKKEK